MEGRLRVQVRRGRIAEVMMAFIYLSEMGFPKNGGAANHGWSSLNLDPSSLLSTECYIKQLIKTRESPFACPACVVERPVLYK